MKRQRESEGRMDKRARDQPAAAKKVFFMVETFTTVTSRQIPCRPPFDGLFSREGGG
jgi:hypothetical protein